MENINSVSICLKLDCNDIMNWKSPAFTATFLVLINVGYLIFKYLNISVISLATQKLFYFTIILIIKKKLFNKDEEYYFK